MELIICLFSIFKVMEPLGKYMEEFYALGEYKLTRVLCCYFSCIAYLFYIYQRSISCNSHEIYFGTVHVND
jgi:hypothetical protein